MSDMTPEQAAALREPFPAAAIGKLPKALRRDSSKGDCEVCGGYHGLPAVHLDYVGHAATTDRLLKVDAAWTWEPVAFDADGAPLIRRNGSEAEMWIKLTVRGVTRYGVGTASANSFDLPKQLIGDAIRNAAMRFGVALDLWAKEDLHDIQNPPAEAEPPAPMSSSQQTDMATRTAALSDEQKAELNTWYKAQKLPKLDALSHDQAARVLDKLHVLAGDEEPF
jgi:hypothetical protein